MKLLNKIALVTLAASASLVQASDISQFAKEDSWADMPVQVADYSDSIALFATDRASFRLGKIPGQISAMAEMVAPSSPGIQHSHFAKFCDMNPSMTYLKSENNEFTLKVRLNPAALLRSGVNTSRGILAVENLPKAWLPQAKVSVLAGSKMGPLQTDPSQIERSIQAQLKAQLSSITEQGVATLSFSGVDDFACDLATGKATLTFGIRYDLESGKLKRTPILSATEVSTVSGFLKDADGGAIGDPISAAVMNGANLGIGLNRVTSKLPKDLGVSRFIRIYRKLFDLNSGRLTVVNDANKTSRDLDDTAVASETQNVSISQTIKIVSDQP